MDSGCPLRPPTLTGNGLSLRKPSHLRRLATEFQAYTAVRIIRVISGGGGLPASAGLFPPLVMDNKKSKKEVRESPLDEATKAPLKRFTQGSVSAAVFANEREVKGELRTFYNLTASRSYEKDGKFYRSYSYGYDDVPKLIKVLRDAHAFLHDQMSA